MASADQPEGMRLARENTSWLERVAIAPLVDIRFKGRELLLLQRAFRSSLRVGRAVLDPARFPVLAELRRGGNVELRNRREVYLYSRPPGASEYRLIAIEHHPPEPPIYRFRRLEDGRHVDLECPENMGDPSIFVNGEYGGLSVRDRDVVDVGAGAGETAIYFAQRGARSVTAFEPFPDSFEYCERNVVKNGVDKVVHLHRAALSDSEGHVSVDPEGGKGTDRALAHRQGVATPRTSLSAVVQRLGLDDATLKMDCEGDEYRILLSTEPGVLRRFLEIFLEYHYGARTLERHLVRSGFSVDVTLPVHYFGDPNPNLFCGRLHAHRI